MLVIVIKTSVKFKAFELSPPPAEGKTKQLVVVEIYWSEKNEI